MKSKGLTISIIFQAESANYGEGLGNVTSLKKISRGAGEQYSYISRQAIRYNIVNQMGIDDTPIGLDKTVLQFDKEAKIDEHPEIDLFGYMKTGSETKTRSAVVRLSNAISLETFKGDLDFLTNKGLLDRYTKTESKDGGNISQSEIHRSYYAYTITIDLDQVGIDSNDNIEIKNSEKSERIENLLDTVKYLYRDIKGRREDLSPLFVIGGVYDIKNPLFYNALDVKENNLVLDRIESVLEDKKIKNNTEIGLVKGVFYNSEEIEKLNPIPINEFFNNLKIKVKDYYESN
ncbi:MAG: type I-B CRISPR-associated protein Cas7/Cst2/DevR [Miniphocaeibacter sp.]|uniref:type I-B CRISPR-associated protein Cas7/Cst2/DevR n=1 Tax=Miniphocaeibacter sp. TaxID=3100973 RepID=UPI0017C11A67|nr:type I-B CRISPR-associated protein Cas7/Cst2/DevR [Gallicola sp.]